MQYGSSSVPCLYFGLKACVETTSDAVAAPALHPCVQLQEPRHPKMPYSSTVLALPFLTQPIARMRWSLTDEDDVGYAAEVDSPLAALNGCRTTGSLLVPNKSPSSMPLQPSLVEFGLTHEWYAGSHLIHKVAGETPGRPDDTIHPPSCNSSPASI